MDTAHYGLFGGSMKNISMSDAKNHLAEFVTRAASGERFMILRRERPLAAIIGAGELARLKHLAVIVRRLARVLGQSKRLLQSIEAGKTHPAMAAYGLWADEAVLAGPEKTIQKNRRGAAMRPEVEL
jgi:prevent-host-death family protein